MKGNNKPTHNVNSANYSSAPNDVDTDNTPFTVSYDQASANISQAPQHYPANNSSCSPNPNYRPVNPALISPQLSYATSGASYNNNKGNADMGSRVADVVRNIDTDRIANNIESGIGYVADRANEFTTTAKDKLANPSRRKMLAILGGAVASLALAISLGSNVINKADSSRNTQTPPAATSTNSPSAGSNQVTEIKDTNPNMNVETADSEHDGKIEYRLYKYLWGEENGYRKVKDTSVSVQYDSSESEDDRKEITSGDLLDELAGKKGATGSIDEMIDVNDGKTTKNIGTALQNLLIENGNHKNTANKNPYTGKPMEIQNNSGVRRDIVSVEMSYDYTKMMSSSKRNLSTGRIILMITSKNSEYQPHFDRFHAYIYPNHEKAPNTTYMNAIYSFDHIPTAREFAKIIEENEGNFYTSILDDRV